jgi:L-ascorbate metabolism protein UlaG (beta-lactamase superfamily)
MIITHHGKQFFKLQTGDRVIALNPIAKDSKFKTSGFGADIALISSNHADYHGVDTVTYGDRAPFVIDGPGEYEVSGIMFRGFVSKGADDTINTIYYFEFDDIKICFLGALYEGTLPTDAREAIDQVDLLFIPIGGKSVINYETAAKLARTFEARMIVPMDYGNDQESGSLQKFIKESGTSSQTVEKLTLKLKDFSGKEGEVVVFA